MVECSFKNTMQFCKDLAKYTNKHNLNVFRNLVIKQRFIQQSVDTILLEEDDFNDILLDLQKNASKDEVTEFMNGGLVTHPYA